MFEANRAIREKNLKRMQQGLKNSVVVVTGEPKSPARHHSVSTASAKFFNFGARKDSQIFTGEGSPLNQARDERKASSGLGTSILSEKQ